jgi:hypothetical protein
MATHIASPRVARHGAQSSLAILTLIVASAALCAATDVSEPQNEMPALQEAPLKQYRALRRMHARNSKFNQEAWVDAWTELNGTSFTYEIASERGSDYIKDKVLKMILAREQELVAKGEAGRAEICGENYQFEESEPPDDSFRYVLLKPKRKDILLVNGRMILNSAGTQLIRVEGTLAKNPSFWTSTVNIVRDFAMVDGVRVPVATATVAKLKLAGQAHLEVRYEYESINGRQVDAASAHRVSGAPAASLRTPDPQTGGTFSSAGIARVSARSNSRDAVSDRD